MLQRIADEETRARQLGLPLEGLPLRSRLLNALQQRGLSPYQAQSVLENALAPLLKGQQS